MNGDNCNDFHVIGDHREFQVELNDGTTCQPIEILGIDRSQDLALFRVNATNLHPIPPRKFRRDHTRGNDPFHR